MVAALLHLVNHPVPMPGGFERDLATRWQAAEEVDGVLALMFDGTAGEVLPFASMVTKTENCFCASHPMVAGMGFSYLAQVALS
jgi:hypothetical protein